MPVLSTRVQWIQMVYSHQQQETGNGLQATIHCAYIYVYIYILYIYIILQPMSLFQLISTWSRLHECTRVALNQSII